MLPNCCGNNGEGVLGQEIILVEQRDPLTGGQFQRGI